VTLATGTRLGPYEILSPLGAGGMGEVYRAKDSKLNREVAVKVLPESLAGDADALARFEREAHAVAALNHPNILSIHDFGSEGGVSYAVAELLVGETLRARIGEGALSQRRAVEIAIQIAKGLAAAHEKGIIHRDLKPENVFLTSDGRVKILDFGLAKRMGLEAAETNAPTAAGTQPGTVMGTVGYMSPEQVRGRDLDHRTDIFSFGAILYEMLAGKRAFKGDSHVETLNAILKEDPPELLESGRNISPALDRIVRHCLEKSPEARFHSAGDIAFDLDAISNDSSSSAAHATTGRVGPSSRLGRAGLVVGALALLALAYIAGTRGAKKAPGAPEYRQLTMLPGEESSPSLSPDGQAFAFVAGSGAKPDIFVQRVDGKSAIDLTADCAKGSADPAFSPKGDQIAYRSECGSGIFVMGATGENPRRLTDSGFNPAWSPDGKEIAFGMDSGSNVYSRNGTGPLWAVDVESGKKRQITQTDGVAPNWSPHGLRIAYWGLPKGTGNRVLFTVSARGGEAPVPVTGLAETSLNWNPVWSGDGKWLYFASNRGGTANIWRVAIDEKSGRLEEVPEPVSVAATTVGKFSLSRDGKRLVFEAVAPLSEIRKVSFDPERGVVVGQPTTAFRAAMFVVEPDISPDGDEIVFRSMGRQENIFRVRTDGTKFRQLTDDVFKNRGPEWSPDRTRIAFYSDRGGRYEVWTIRPDGSGLTQITRTNRDGAWFPQWSPDGRSIAYPDGTGSEIVHLDPPGKTDRLPDLKDGNWFQVWQWSPDARELLGQTGSLNAPGGLTVYSLQDRKYEQLTETGGLPKYLPDGRRILYWDRDGLRIFDRTTKTSRLVLPDPSGEFAGYTMSREGKSIYVLVGQTEGDIWSATWK
jgi:Tol biopolymer transport system component